jgi:hypothetical protein
MLRNPALPALAVTFAGVASTAGATESIEFVAEHLPEIAMDNRYAALPLWNTCDGGGDPREYCYGVNLGYARTHSETLSIDGPMAAMSFTRRLGESFRLTGFLFFDQLALGSGVEHRPLEVRFASPPLDLPADAQFTGLDGQARDAGVGLALNGNANWRWLPPFEWSAGLMWQQVRLRDYRFDYLVTGGADAGAAGTLDYSATYSYAVPFFGAAWPRVRGPWRYAPHVQVAAPLPPAPIQGRITGPGFDLAGETGDIGDPSVTIGFNVSYEPWNLTLDLGSTLTQALLEPHIHEGVKHNLMLAAYWTF